MSVENFKALIVLLVSDEDAKLIEAAMAVGVFLLAILAEALTSTHPVADAVCAQEALDNIPSYSAVGMRFWLKVRYPWGEQVLRTLEHTMQLAIRFLLFYVCVTATNRVPFLAMLAGSAIGYVLFRRMQPPPITVSFGAPIIQPQVSVPVLPTYCEKHPQNCVADEESLLGEPQAPLGTWHICSDPDQIV